MHGSACPAPRPATFIINDRFAVHVFMANMQKSLISVLLQQSHGLDDRIQKDVGAEFGRTVAVSENCKDYRVAVMISASRERYMVETIQRQLLGKQRRQQIVQVGILKLWHLQTS
jgi:hypothetical protein